MNLLAGLGPRIAEVEDFQDRFNGMTAERKSRALFQFDTRLARLFERHRLTCMCTDCDKVMDSTRRFEQGCEFCGSSHIVSEYYC
jgi:hypothetical protein